MNKIRFRLRISFLLFLLVNVAKICKIVQRSRDIHKYDKYLDLFYVYNRRLDLTNV